MDTNHKKGRYVLAALLGAIGGGLVVAVATKAVPKLMSGMMQNMMSQMGEARCNPADICQQLIAGFGEAHSEENEKAEDS